MGGVAIAKTKQVRRLYQGADNILTGVDRLNLNISHFRISFKEPYAYKAGLIMRALNHSRALKSFFTFFTPCLAHPRRYASTRISEPLRILFCGSEAFSVASLRALYEEHRRQPGLIASIDVVCRPAKRVGRGLKQFREGNKPRNQFKEPC